jgi:hypothetical protein
MCRPCRLVAVLGFLERSSICLGRLISDSELFGSCRTRDQEATSIRLGLWAHPLVKVMTSNLNNIRSHCGHSTLADCGQAQLIVIVVPPSSI